MEETQLFQDEDIIETEESMEESMEEGIGEENGQQQSNFQCRFVPRTSIYLYGLYPHVSKRTGSRFQIFGSFY